MRERWDKREEESIIMEMEGIMESEGRRERVTRKGWRNW